jgi:hypothetical protein
MTIKQRQHLLAYLGYYVGDVDGEWGQLSQTACKAFQKDYGGLTPDGICGTATEKALKHAVAYGMPKKQEAEKITASSGDFWDGIKYFKKDEFKCKCGGKYCNGFPAEPKEKLIKVADRVRAHFGNKMIVSSGVRCEKHNANVGGVSGSRHKQGKAMDFSVSGMSASMVLAYVQKQPEIRYAYAIDSQFVHMDIE